MSKTCVGIPLANVPLEEICLGMVVKSKVTGNIGVVSKIDIDYLDGDRRGILNVLWINGNLSAGYYRDGDYPEDDQHFTKTIVIGHISDLDNKKTENSCADT